MRAAVRARARGAMACGVAAARISSAPDFGGRALGMYRARRLPCGGHDGASEGASAGSAGPLCGPVCGARGAGNRGPPG